MEFILRQVFTASGKRRKKTSPKFCLTEGNDKHDKEHETLKVIMVAYAIFYFQKMSAQL